MNGHQVLYTIPKDVEVLELKFRETGYDTELAGSFSCEEQFYNKLWDKSLRTLYITMRDTYMDCPDRERAQWWGDVVNELGEAFYSLDQNAHLLTRKAILELMNWQRPIVRFLHRFLPELESGTADADACQCRILWFLDILYGYGRQKYD